MFIARFSGTRIQTVWQHLKEVSEYCSDFAKYNNLENTAKLCGIIHDIGKYSDGFQNYIAKARENIILKKVDHGVYGAKYIYDLYGDKKGYEKMTCDIIVEVVCYHHGGLPDNINSENKITILERMAAVSNENMNFVKAIFDAEKDVDIIDLFEKAVEEIKEVFLKIQNNSRFGLGLFIKYLYSVLVDADRYDSYVFESSITEKESENPQDLWEIYSKNLDISLETFKLKKCKTVLEEKVKSVREEISNDCKNFANHNTGIYTLTVPTGGGKTFASLRFALNHAKKHKKQRIYYIMPYTTIIEQNANEVRNILNCGDNLLEYHSNVLDCNKNDDYEILSERWTSPIIFTTMVQFLNTIYATGNQNIRRMHNLSNAVIIFDEIQALPIKCMNLFYESIYFLNKFADTTAVLCTATQPKLDILKDKIHLDIDGEIIANVNKPFEELKRMNVIDETDNAFSIEELSNFVVKIKETTTSLLVVLNTINVANELFNLIKSKKLYNTTVFLLTTRLCPEHRKAIINNIKIALADRQNIICVSTQLIEAGVDISFTTTIRSLAGLDSIAQTTGRGNRHGENNICNSYIINLNEENLSGLSQIKLAQIYTKEVLNKYKNNPDIFANSLLSPQAIEEYYNRFYGDKDIKNEMKYPIKKYPIKAKDEGGYIYNLLLEEKDRKNRITGKYPLSFSYQFETARKNFEVIDTKTTTVIVPYNEQAKNIIAILLSNKPIFGKIDAIKQSQKYCVNIYSSFFHELQNQNAFIECDFEGIYILSEAYYDEERGITKIKNNKFIAY